MSNVDDFNRKRIERVYKKYRERIEAVVGGVAFLDQATANANGTIFYLMRGDGSYRNAGRRPGNMNDLQIAYWKLVQLPGCCGVAVSTGLNIKRDFRGRGLNNILILLREELAKDQGYGAIIATTISDKRGARPENSTLRKANFLELSTFQNPRTGNELLVWFRNLQDFQDKPTKGPF